MKRRVVAAVGIVAALCIAGGGGWYWWKHGASSGDEEKVYVTTVATLMGDVSGTQNRYAGIVEPQKTVNVKVDGDRRVKEIKVKVGDHVKAGTVLFEYDASDTQNALAQAQLDLDRYKNEAQSLESQIKTLNDEKAKAPADEQLSYTIEIQTAEMDLKKNEYNQKSKQAEIERLSGQSGDLAVTSEIDGVVKTINESAAGSGSEEYSDDYTDEDSAPDSGNGESNFMTIVATGNYRVKGTINETNMNSITEGDPVIIRSRVDDDVTWTGVMTGVDTSETEEDDEMSSYSMSAGEGSEQTNSSDYPFYVELNSVDGLVLGQHVYIEPDNGQGERKEGIWLDDFYIVDIEGEPYVWASSPDDRLEKRSVTLGDYDEEQSRYQITEGLTKNDCIAFPDDTYEEGMKTSIEEENQTTEDMSDTDMEMDDSMGEGFESSEEGVEPW